MSDVMTQEVEVVDIQPIVIVPQTDELSQVVSEINRLSVDINTNDLLTKKHGKVSLEMAITTGGLLSKCKEILRKSKSSQGWEDWFAENITGFTVRSGQYYTQLFRQKTKDSSFFDDCDSISEALRKIQYIKAIAQLTVAPESEPSEQPDKEPEPEKSELHPLTTNTFKDLHPDLYRQWLSVTTRQEFLNLSKTMKKDIFRNIEPRCFYNLNTWTFEEFKIKCGDGHNTYEVNDLKSDIVKWFKSDWIHILPEDQNERKITVLMNCIFRKVSVDTLNTPERDYTEDWKESNDDYKEVSDLVFRVINHVKVEKGVTPVPEPEDTTE